MNLLTTFLILGLLNFYSSSDVPTLSDDLTLKVRINNIKDKKGNITVCLSIEDDYCQATSAEHFPKPCQRVIKHEADENEILVQFDHLKPGTYAVIVVHDINGDDRLNTNFLNIPNEPYGFSNNHRGTFGPPGFSKSSFELTKDLEIDISLH